MELSLLPETTNGGFPEPPAAGPIRVIAARHAACGEATRVRLPEAVPARAVRHLHCERCDQDFETSLIEELGVEEADVAEIMIRALADVPASNGGGFALPEFNMPSFGELKLPGTPRFEAPEPVFAEPAQPLEVEPVREVEPVFEIEPVEVPAPPPLKEAIAVELVELTEQPANVVDARTVEAAPAAPKPSPRRELKLPQVSLPEVKLPRVKLPRLSQIKLPKLPAIKAPQLSRVKLPKLPELKRPALAGQSVTLPKLPSLPKLSKLDPSSPVFRLASAAVAVVAVILLLGAIQGDDNKPIAPQLAVATDTTPSDLPSADELRAANADSDEVMGSVIPTNPAASDASEDTKLVRGSTYSLALPAGWKRTIPEGNAAFAAQSADGGADAQLWISEDPKLDFPTFINLSLQQLETLAGSAEVVERIPGPNPETTVVRLAADSPEGMPSYEVTLRAAGPYRYYLATSVQPDASPEAAEGAELIVGSFTPEAGE